MTWIDSLLMGSLFVVTAIILLVVIGSSIGPSSDAVLFWMSLVMVIGHTAYNVRLAMQANATELEKVRVCGCAGTSRDVVIDLNCRHPPSSVFVNFDRSPHSQLDNPVARYKEEELLKPTMLWQGESQVALEEGANGPGGSTI